MYVEITSEMIYRAKQEAEKRDPFINHHFEVGHLSKQERDVIGFLGEFAGCVLFNKDWQNNIRENYFTIDSGDLIEKNKIFDVKTETIPRKNLDRILKGLCSDDELYGRRLINGAQVPLLNKYDIIIFGAFERGNYNKWYPLGYMESSIILKEYRITHRRPDGGNYPFPGLPIHTSRLKKIESLMRA